MEILKLLSASEIVAQIINFLLLLLLLRIFFWKRILRLLDERKMRIAAELEHAAQVRNAADGLKADYQARLGVIEETSRLKIRQAEEQGREIVEQLKKEARLEADKIISSARVDIKHEIAKAKEELKEEIIDLALEAAGNLVSEKLTEEDDRKIVAEFLDKLDQPQ